MLKKLTYHTLIGGAVLGLALAFSAGPAAAQVCDPKVQKCPPPKDGTADCSPGYYKNHPNTWDDGICCAGDALTSGTECNTIFVGLNAHGPGSGAIRGFFADLLNACFGTAADSPCTDD